GGVWPEEWVRRHGRGRRGEHRGRQTPGAFGRKKGRPVGGPIIQACRRGGRGIRPASRESNLDIAERFLLSSPRSPKKRLNLNCDSGLHGQHPRILGGERLYAR